MANEVWKDIPSYEGLYQVSNLGNVKSLNFHRENKECILKTHKNRCGYLEVRLYKKGTSKVYSIHRLVMLAFVGESNLTVNHKDENKENNRLCNLEYMTKKENVRYSQAFKIMGVNIVTGEKIYFNSITETNIHGFSQPQISKVLNGKYKQHKGYKWEVCK